MARRDEGFFSAKDNLRLYWETTYPDGEPKAHVGVVHGYGDHCGRYRGVIDSLAAQGLVVHAFDYRGHGQADGRRGFCDRFTDLIDDLDLFWQRLRGAAQGKKTFLLAHSNGGLMAVHWVLARRPEGLAGLLLSAPYLRLALTPPASKIFAAKVVGRMLPWLPIKTELTPQDLTRDLDEQRKVEKDPLYNRMVTPRWFIESGKAQLEAMAQAGGLKSPLLVFCGEADKVASPDAAREFFEHAGSADKRFKVYPGMRHEPLNEIGREEVYRDISGWISEHL
ncbi:MAG TPA: lysophospholipase [Myxococcaceae bacterium]|nr:lysophospholipase [Myxococcaceae bacterium]